MTAGLSAKLATSLIGQFSSTSDLSSVLQQINEALSTDFQPGTGVGHASEVFIDVRTLAASTSENLDMSGVLSDAFGHTVTFTKIRALILLADAGNGALVKFGGASSNALLFLADATDIVPLDAGASLVLSRPAGITVTAGTGDILKVANTDSVNQASYTIFAIGE